MKWWSPPSRWANEASMKFTILFVALALVGCGSSSSTTGSTGGGSGTGGGVGTGGGSGTGGGVGTGGGSGTGGGMAATGGTGLVRIQQTATNVAVVRSATASFYVNAGPTMLPGGALSCVKTQSGSCVVEDCTQDGGTVFFDAGIKTTAGTLTIEVGNDGGHELPFLAGSGIYNGQNLGMGQWWNGGETISITATGSTDGGTPAFTKTLPAPTLLVFSSPAADAGTLTVTRNMPFTLTWAAGTGTAKITLQTGSTSMGHALTVTCTANANAGTFTVPAAVTNQLVPTNAGSVAVVNESTAMVAAGSAMIQTSALSASKTWTANVP